MTGRTTSQALTALAAPLRRLAGLALGLTLAGGVLAVLGGTAWMVRLGLVRTPGWVLAAWLVAFVATGVTLFRARRGASRLAPRALADALEASNDFRLGSVSLLLDHAAGGTSPGFFGAADSAQAAAVETRGPDALAGVRGQLHRGVRIGSAVAAAGVVLLASAGPVGGTAAALWRPDLAWESLIAPVQLTPSAETVDRGESVTLSVLATGRREAVLWTRATGEAWAPQRVVLDSLGRADHRVGPLTGDLYARLAAGNRSSDTVHVRVRLPVFVGSLVVTAQYPGYLGLDPEPLPVTGDTLLVPEGTVLRTEGRATGALRTAVWQGESGDAPLDVRGEEFSGSFTPRVSGAWQLAIVTGEGLAPTGEAARIAVRVVPDSAPVVDVPVPGKDTVEAPEGALALVIDVRDDHGLTRVTLETRRGSEPVRVRELELAGDRPDRALLTTTLDGETLGLVPGDTLRYLVRAADNAPTPRIGRSREFVLVVPTRSELREAQREASANVGRQLDSLAARSRQLERETEDLSRTRPRGEEARGRNAESMSFDEARRAEEVARAQTSLLDDVQRVEDALKEMQRAAERGGIADSAFERRIAEIRQELDQALTPELRAQLAALQEALRNLDAPRAREAMQQLGEAQQQLREALERSKELFKRAAMEGEMGALAQEAAEVSQAQRQLTETMMRADSNRVAAAEQALAQRADSLAAGIERASERMENAASRQEMQQAAQAARQASQQMQKAAQSAQKGQRSQARAEGQQAETQMGQVQQQVDEQREQQQEEWRQEVLDALDQALLETTRLTVRQLAVAQGFRRGVPAATLRNDQAGVEEGARQLIEQVMNAGGKNALVPPQIAGALSAARQQMALARGAIAAANLNLRDGAERAGEAVDALNVASFMLLRARGDVGNSSSGSGMAEAMERMAQLAQQQGGIGQDAASLLPMMSGGAASEQRLQEIAARQRQMARDLDRLRAETDAGAAEALAEEARELARQLEAGRLDPETVARQERLFRRMLDAGRTLQGEEEDEQKERESRTARDVDPRLPPALRARLLGEDGRPRLPSWEELQRYSPEERRLVADYFRRLTGGGR